MFFFIFFFFLFYSVGRSCWIWHTHTHTHTHTHVLLEWNLSFVECLWSAERFVLFKLFLILCCETFLRHSKISMMMTYFTIKVMLACTFAENVEFVCFINHSKDILSLRGVTWNSRNWIPISRIPICDVTAIDRIGIQEPNYYTGISVHQLMWLLIYGSKYGSCLQEPW